MKFNTKFSYLKHELQFIKPANTSRGSMQTHTTYFILANNKNIIGIGEAAPLPGLSIDYSENFETHLKTILNQLNNGENIESVDLTNLPSIKFALETSLADLKYGGVKKICENNFIKQQPIAINGLVWMNEINEMQEEAFNKIEMGFNCIKLKIGSLDFDEECKLLEKIRKKYSAFKLEIRVDANGAFANEDALEKLKELNRFDLHSLEQPIKSKQLEWMQEICAKSPIAIALDEELIGVKEEEIFSLLQFTKPKFIILKPTLIGGFNKSKTWIDYANKLNIKWWFTSALESNIGLNAIAQYCSYWNTTMPQGLGTGSLFKNNIESPLLVKNGFLFYQKNTNWNLNLFNLNELGI